jgi:hypothetical protein
VLFKSSFDIRFPAFGCQAAVLAGRLPALSIILPVMPCGISANAESLREAADKQPANRLRDPRN